MKRQRGLAMIAIYALLALAGIVSLIGWWEMHNYQVRKAEREKWAAALEVCKTNTETAVEANKTLAASAEQLAAKVKDQNAQIEDLAKAEGAARTARDTALAAALQRERLLRTQINQLTVIAQAPAVPQTPEVCNEAASVLRALVADRV